MRVLARVEAGRRRKRRALFAVVPLAAALLVSSAWAAAGGRLPARLEEIGASVFPAAFFRQRHRGVAAVAPSPPAISPAAAAVATPPAQALTPVPDRGESVALTPPAALDGMAWDRSRHRPALAHAIPAVTPLPPASTTSAAFAHEEALYDAAHHTHFVTRDPSAALRAWDAYLAEYPQGTYALEAKYNRAITLARLGRRDAARSALAPFASGAYGGYRRVEAQHLIEALDALRP
jgi:TolA-binding protein